MIHHAFSYLALALLAACATAPAEQFPPNLLSTQAAGYYKYRLSLQRESSFFKEYGFLRIDTMDGHDRISICKDVRLGNVSFQPKRNYKITHQQTDLGNLHSFIAWVPLAEEAKDGQVQIDTLVSKDGMRTVFVAMMKDNRYQARTPTTPATATEFDASCTVDLDAKKL